MQDSVQKIDSTGVIIPLIFYSDASFNSGPANAFHPVMLALGSLPRHRMRKRHNQLRIAHLPVLHKASLNMSDAQYACLRPCLLFLPLEGPSL